MQKSDKLMLQEMNMPLRPVGDKLRAISSKTPPLEGNRKQRRAFLAARRHMRKKFPRS